MMRHKTKKQFFSSVSAATCGTSFGTVSGDAHVCGFFATVIDITPKRSRSLIYGFHVSFFPTAVDKVDSIWSNRR